MGANLCIYACRDDQDELLKFKLSKLRICIKGDLSDFEWFLVMGRLLGFTENGQKRENIQRAVVLWVKMMPEVRGEWPYLSSPVS